MIPLVTIRNSLTLRENGPDSNPDPKIFDPKMFLLGLGRVRIRGI